MDSGVWQASVHRDSRSQARLNRLTTHVGRKNSLGCLLTAHTCLVNFYSSLGTMLGTQKISFKQLYNLLHFTDDKNKMQRSSDLSKSELSSELNSTPHLKGSKVCVHLPTMLERGSVCVCLINKVYATKKLVQGHQKVGQLTRVLKTIAAGCISTASVLF